jgi:hypothetical protein
MTPREPKTIWLPAEMYQRLRAEARRRGISISRLAEIIFKDSPPKVTQ